MGSGRRWLVVAIVVAAVAGGAVAWQLSREDDPYADYCAEVQEHQEGIGEELAAGGETTGLIDALPAFRLLQEEAPDDVADEWAVVVDRLERLESAIEEAGADPATYDRADPPAEVDEEEQAGIDAAAAALAAPESREAFAGVAQHARDVCHTPLHL
jgi:hypothetical protein